MQNSEHAAEGFSSKIDSQTLVVALQDLSNSIQELAADPSSFVLHRTQCCALAKSYVLTVRHVTQELHICSQDSAVTLEYLHHHLHPSLSELHHAMLQGWKFMQDCVHGDGWVKKALVLALSTEAQDVCLHDLVWCLCLIQQAMGHVFLQRDELEGSVYASLNATWAETSQKQDLDVLLETLQRDIAIWENQLSGKNLSVRSSKELASQHGQAKFLLEKLSRKYHLDNEGVLRIDALPWANPGDFTIKDVIGHGGYAVVYEVKWHGEIYGQKEFFGVKKSVFAEEAGIQARLRHPNLIQLICCTSRPKKNRCSLVMELMEMDLRSKIDDRLKAGFNPPFPLLTSVDIMLQIAKGMEHLHSLNIMHRDLKSANLLISNQMPTNETSSECRMRVKVADFGMSKAKNLSSKYTTLHTGTTYWRAPEVFEVHPESEFQGQSTAKYTKKADVYSFALVCYEILSGNIPFADGGKLCHLHQRLLKGERPILPSSCPAYLVSYIGNCWHGDPVRRPTFSQISRTLRHLKGVLLTRMTDPQTPLALAAGSFTRIEENLEKKMGPKWASTVSNWFSTRTMTISFEMSWYQVMEKILTQNEEDKAALMSSTRMICQGLICLSVCGNSCHNRMMKWQCSNLRHGVSVTLKWFYQRLCFCIAIHSLFVLGRQKDNGSRWHGSTSPCPISVQTRPSKALAMPCSGLRTGLEVFSYSDLAQATANFDVSAQVGVGGSSSVYRGILADGRVVAVKVLSSASRTMGDAAFLSELDLMSRVIHINLVRLLGYCDDKGSPILVYEYMSRGDLGRWLYGEQEASVLSWAQRYEIACGVASALDHLHNGISPRIVHRDVKPSNILLDDGFKAHLSDFGIALRQRTGNEFGDSIVRGSVGYMDPEYMHTLRLGPEVDVYSYGVVLLQLVSGRSVLQDHISVFEYVSGLVEKGRPLDAVDERLRVDGYLNNQDQIYCLLELGLTCCQKLQRNRLRMNEVVQTLREARTMEFTPPHSPDWNAEASHSGRSSDS